MPLGACVYCIRLSRAKAKRSSETFTVCWWSMCVLHDVQCSSLLNRIEQKWKFDLMNNTDTETGNMCSTRRISFQTNKHLFIFYWICVSSLKHIFDCIGKLIFGFIADDGSRYFIFIFYFTLISNIGCQVMNIISSINQNPPKSYPELPSICFLSTWH